jgi:thiosulfate dehydrogenase [quinone] large subunit
LDKEILAMAFILPILRVFLGWIFFYAGASKLLSPEWTAAGFLKAAKTFSGFYNWFALPQNIGWVNFLNEWGLTLIGVALILGVFLRLASACGITLMILYYFPQLEFPMVGKNSFLIDQHVIYSLVLLALAVSKEARNYSLDLYVKRLPFVKGTFLSAL